MSVPYEEFDQAMEEYELDSTKATKDEIKDHMKRLWRKEVLESE